MEKCENCSKPIGKLETPFIFNDHVVCATCYQTLRPAVPAPTQRAASLDYKVILQTPSRRDDSKQDFGKSFVSSHLSEKEQVLFKTQLHWLVFVAPAVFSAIFLLLAFGMLAAAASGSTRSSETGQMITFAIILIVVVIAVDAIAIGQYFTTEFAVTSRRVVVKKGFLSRASFETLLTKIESVRLSQGLVERLCGAGTIVTIGTGGSHDPIRRVSRPLEFRRQIEEQIARLERHV